MASTWTSGGASAGAATNSKLGLLVKDEGSDIANVSPGSYSPDKFPRQPEEGLFKVVVGLGGNLEILEVLFPVESDSAGLYFALLNENQPSTLARSDQTRENHEP